MNIAVIRNGTLTKLPPAMSLVSALLDLGCSVTLIASGIADLPKRITEQANLETIDLGAPTSALDKTRRLHSVPQAIRKFLKDRIGEFDYVWTTSDTDARDAGDILFSTNHIMFLPELLDYVPLLTQKRFPLKSAKTIEIARRSKEVVVPEYNRAHIQKALWKLPATPTVLPNKPYPDPMPMGEKDGRYAEVQRAFVTEKRKILLYQGVLGPDRDLEPYVRAAELLGDEYVVCAMGKAASTYSMERERSLASRSSALRLLGYVPAPDHLRFTKYGYIGLLPYRPSCDNRNSVLNALYCAPNKIWEYSRFGIPMLGSDVPGLASAFVSGGMGLAVTESPESIADAIHQISIRYDSMSVASKVFYESFDYRHAVSKILGIE